MLDIGRIETKFKIWESLMDASLYFALAGMKLRGNSEEVAWELLRQAWGRVDKEHYEANLKIVRRLNDAGNKGK